MKPCPICGTEYQAIDLHFHWSLHTKNHCTDIASCPFCHKKLQVSGIDQPCHYYEMDLINIVLDAHLRRCNSYAAHLLAGKVLT